MCVSVFSGVFRSPHTERATTLRVSCAPTNTTPQTEWAKKTQPMNNKNQLTVITPSLMFFRFRITIPMMGFLANFFGILLACCLRFALPSAKLAALCSDYRCVCASHRTAPNVFGLASADTLVHTHPRARGALN